MSRQNALSNDIFDNSAHMCTYFSRMIPVIPYTCLTGKEIKKGWHRLLFPEADSFLIRKNMGFHSPFILDKIDTPNELHTYEQYLVSPIDEKDNYFSLLTDIKPNDRTEYHGISSEECSVMNIIEKQICQMKKWGKHEIFFASYKGKLGYCGMKRLQNTKTNKTQPVYQTAF